MAGQNEIDVTVETNDENDDFTRLSVKSQVGNGTDNRHTVKGTVQRETLADVQDEREALTAEVKETAREALANGTDVRDDVLDDDE